MLSTTLYIETFNVYTQKLRNPAYPYNPYTYTGLKTAGHVDKIRAVKVDTRNRYRFTCLASFI